MAKTVGGYSRAQVWLHWAVAALVVFQVAGHEGIEAVYGAAPAGTPDPSDLLWADVHVVCGIAVLAAGIARIWLRLARGAPPLPEEENRWLRGLAHLTHVLLHAVLVALPVTGGLAWFAGVDAAARLHTAALPLLAALVVLHSAGALYQHFALRTDVLRRMLRAGPPTRPPPWKGGGETAAAARPARR